MASDAKRVIIGTILSICHFHLMSDGAFWVESGRSLQFGVERDATTLINLVPIDQLLPYSSRRVAVAFAYADHRGEQANRANG